MTPTALAPAAVSPAALKRRMQDCKAFRISPHDSNYMAVVFDPRDEGGSLVAVVEIFDAHGRTPPNMHQAAAEFFFVLHGHGRARVGDEWTELAPGDALMVRRGAEHVVENTGDGRLYCLTVMVPDENFAAAILAGTPVELDAEDRRIIAGPCASR